MISANGGLPAHRYTPEVTQRWPRGSELSMMKHCRLDFKICLPLTCICNPDLGLLFYVDFVLTSFSTDI